MTKLKKIMDDHFTKASSLAKMLGVHSATIYNWREGTSRLPAEAALIIAGFYGVNVEEVIGEVNKPVRRCDSKLQRAAV